jgi:hypothetical protein
VVGCGFITRRVITDFFVLKIRVYPVVDSTDIVKTNTRFRRSLYQFHYTHSSTNDYLEHNRVPIYTTDFEEDHMGTFYPEHQHEFG